MQPPHSPETVAGVASWRTLLTRDLERRRWTELEEDDGGATASAPVPSEVLLQEHTQSKPMLVETDVEYTGERPSVLGFIFMFKDIIFRMDASVLRFIVMETTIAVLLSFAAMYCTPDEEFSGLGHQFVGMLLSFLTVFRSNTSYHLWEDGRIMLGRINSASRIVANEILGVAAEGAVADGTPTLSDEAHECVRLLKLFYFVVVEHVRSTDGHEPWVFAQNVAFSHATPREVAAFKAEFGVAQPGVQRHLVLPTAPPAVATAWRPPYKMKASTIRLENRYYSQWLRQLALRVKRQSGSGGGHFDHRRVAQALDEALEAFQGVHRVHSVYLPLPYCQLLKIIQMGWIFSLPFVLTKEMGILLPFITFLVAISFFGIDQVGAELDGPFGTDANDLPLLHMGISLVDDLDIVVRTAEETARMAYEDKHGPAADSGGVGAATASVPHTVPGQRQAWGQPIASAPSSMSNRAFFLPSGSRNR